MSRGRTCVKVCVFQLIQSGSGFLFYLFLQEPEVVLLPKKKKIRFNLCIFVNTYSVTNILFFLYFKFDNSWFCGNGTEN